jgi:hypothetical protein
VELRGGAGGLVRHGLDVEGAAEVIALHLNAVTP